VKFNRLQNLLAREVESGRIPGAVALVAQAGEIKELDSVGKLAPKQTNAMTDDAIFWIASMTKPITSVAALMLVEEGALHLSDAVADHLPQLRRLEVQGGVVARSPTILDLMRHTAGFTYGFVGDSPVHAAYRAAGVYDYRQSNSEMLEKLSRIPLSYPPGTTFEYGMSTDVLACIVESCSGQAFEQFLQERLFDPLGMRSTGFSVDREQVHRVARPFAHENFEIAPPAGGGRWMAGGSGLWSTALDYFRFAQMLLNGGELDGVRLLEPETVKAMRTDTLPPDVNYGSYVETLGIVAPTPATGRGFGLGLSVQTSRGEGAVPSSLGDFTWPGVSGTNFWCDPVHQLVVVVMMQAPSLRQQYRELCRTCVYEDLAAA
jgi:CubicO group peptidase (beta-lactamase class C family)